MTRPHVLLLLLLAGVCATQSASLEVQDKKVLNNELSHNGIETLLLEVLEKFRQIMKTGSADLKIPQLDPYVIQGEKLDLDIKEISVKGDIKNLAIPGLSQFKVEDLSLDLAQGMVNINVSLPDISATGQYDLNGAIQMGKISLPLEGNGDLTADLKAIWLSTKVNLGLSNLGQILLDDFVLGWNMSDIQVHLGGLYDESPLGKIINKLLADILPRLVTKTYHDTITSFITTLVKEKGGAYLKDLHEDHGIPTPAIRRVARPVALGDDDEDLESELSLLRAANSGESQDSDAALVNVNVDVSGERPRPLTTQLLFGGVPLQIQMTGDSRFFPHGALSTTSGDDDEEETGEEGEEQDEQDSSEESEEQDEQDSSEMEEDEFENEVDDEEEEKEDKENDDDSLLNVKLLGKLKLYPHGALSKGDE